MTRKLTKFEKIKENIEKIVEEYKEAESTQDERRMSELKAEYEDQKILLYSNEAYFKELSKKELKKEKAETEDNRLINNINAKLRQKKVYSDNKTYIDMVEKSKTIDEYIKNASHKKRNFVKRHFKKFALGITLVAALIAGGTLLSKKSDKSNINNIPGFEDDKNKNDNTETENNGLTEDSSEEKITIDNTTEMPTTDQQPDQNTNEPQTTEEIIVPQDPNIEDTTEIPTTEEIIIPETTTEEPEPEDYPITEELTEEPTDESTEEIVTTEEPTPEDDPTTIDDTTEVPTTEEEPIPDYPDDIITTEEEPMPDYPDDMPIEEPEDSTPEDLTREEIIIEEPITTEDRDIPNKEKVTIIETEEIEPLDNPTKIESDEEDIIYYDEKSETSETTEEEPIPDYPENMPIEDSEEEIIYYENPDVVETDQDIIDFINNNTEIGQIYTLHM